MLQNKKRVISGTPSAVYAQLQNIQDQYGADEIMIQPHVYGEENRKQLLQLIANENKNQRNSPIVTLILISTLFIPNKMH